MKTIARIALGAAMIAGATAAVSVPADARVVVGVGVGVPAPDYYYGGGYYPPGPCDSYDYYYEGDCGYSSYTGRVLIDGVWVTGPHYYRWYGGRPFFWYRGGWHNWAGWNGVSWNWNRSP